MTALHSRWLRFLIGYLPACLKPKPAEVGLLLKVSLNLTLRALSCSATSQTCPAVPLHCFQVTSNGKPVALYSDTSGRHISSISAVTESNGALVFGSLMNGYISMLSLRDLEATVSAE